MNFTKFYRSVLFTVNKKHLFFAVMKRNTTAERRKSGALLPLKARVGYVQNVEIPFPPKNFRFFFIFFAKLSIPSYFIHFFVL